MYIYGQWFIYNPSQLKFPSLIQSISQWVKQNRQGKIVTLANEEIRDQKWPTVTCRRYMCLAIIFADCRK
jgi:hypothetical protein